MFLFFFSTYCLQYRAEYPQLLLFIHSTYTKYIALYTKHRHNISTCLSVSTQNRGKHHYFNSVIIISSSFFNQCQHSKDVIQRNAIRKVLCINVRCHLSQTLHCETENFWSIIKKLDLCYRSKREIFYRIRKVFPIQTWYPTLSESTVVWNILGNEEKCGNCRFKGRSEEYHAATAQGLSCPEEFISSRPVPVDFFFLCWQSL